MSIKKKIEINAAIYPEVMTIHLGKQSSTVEAGISIQNDFVPELFLCLPRDVLNERMKCDYSLYVFKKVDAQDCIRRAERFIRKIESLTV